MSLSDPFARDSFNVAECFQEPLIAAAMVPNGFGALRPVDPERGVAMAVTGEGVARRVPAQRGLRTGPSLHRPPADHPMLFRVVRRLTE